MWWMVACCAPMVLLALAIFLGVFGARSGVLAGKDLAMSATRSTSLGRLGPIERAVRILGGGVLALFAVNLWLTTGGLAAWAWFAVALVGLDFVVTGIRGYCPLYARLGVGRSHERSGA